MKLRELFDPNKPGSGIVVDKNVPPAPAVAPKLGPSPVPTAPVATPAPKLNTTAKPEPAPFHPASSKELLIKIAKQKGLAAVNDLSNFLGQVQVETGNWASAAENFMYVDPVRIYKVFTSKFKNPEETAPYIKNPVALANRALANKNGNGDEASGDGWRYRGRGFIHLTGRDLYAQAGANVHPENPGIYINNPELLSSNPKEAALTAVWYHKTKVGKGKTAKQTTAVVNPAGLKGKERIAASNKIKQQMAAVKKPGQSATPKPKVKK